MIGDMRQHMAQSGFGVDPVQPGRSSQPVSGSGAFAAAVGAGQTESRVGLLPYRRSSPAKSVGVLNALTLLVAAISSESVPEMTLPTITSCST